jgi:Ca2+-binding EF-hand superfamily protein
MTYMAGHYMTKNEEKEMLEAFQTLDLDGNGVLSIDELVEGRI